MNAKILALSIPIVLLVCLVQDYAEAHLDEACKFGFCLNAFMKSIKNSYCDSDNRCRCLDGYVAIGHHRCAEPQGHRRHCEHDNVCRYVDENSYCNRSHSGVCECRPGFHYDPAQRKCIPPMKKKPNTTSLFPVTAIILIACVGIFCGCAIICHNFRRQPELSIDVDHIRRTTRPNHPAAVARAANNNTAPNAEQAVIIQHPPLLRSESRSSSKYDSLLFDDPPPKYEDAIKDYPSEIIVDSQFNRPSLQVLKSS